MNPCCPSCKSIEISCLGEIPSINQFAGRQLGHLIPGGSLYRCNECFLYFRWPRLQKEKMNTLYREGCENHWQYNPQKRKDWKIAANWLNVNLEKGTILDIGCFDGGFLEYLGERWQRYGIEINEMASRKAEERGVHILADDFEKIRFLPMKFDATIALDFIEHTEDPLNFLKLMVGITHPGGVIIISSGNTYSFSWRLMGNKCWYCASPEHISFINGKWCFNAAETLALTMQKVKKFSHVRSNFGAKILEAAVNISYLFSPNITGMLRKRGFGGIDVSMFEEVKLFPPSWLSAKNHIMVFFRKEV